MNKKILYGVLLPIFAVLLVSAVLIEHYGFFQQDIQVIQPISTSGDLTQKISCLSGETCLNDENYIKIVNYANYDIDVQLFSESEPGIEVNYISKLKLDNKNVDWKPISDEREGNLEYSIVGDEFKYKFEAEGLTPNTEYSLIYYADKPDRFVDWGGNNPGALIIATISDDEGNLIIEGSKDLGMNLPSEPDANIDKYNYCASDEYPRCYGAKIWLVLSSDYAEPELNGWNPSEYLFETDLISYSKSSDGIITIPGDGAIEFTPEYTLNNSLETGTYTINTEVNPIVA